MTATQISLSYWGTESKVCGPNSDLGFVSKALASAISHSFLDLSSVFFYLVLCLGHTKHLFSPLTLPSTETSVFFLHISPSVSLKAGGGDIWFSCSQSQDRITNPTSVEITIFHTYPSPLTLEVCLPFSQH